MGRGGPGDWRFEEALKCTGTCEQGLRKPGRHTQPQVDSDGASRPEVGKCLLLADENQFCKFLRNVSFSPTTRNPSIVSAELGLDSVLD